MCGFVGFVGRCVNKNLVSFKFFVINDHNRNVNVFFPITSAKQLIVCSTNLERKNVKCL